MFKRCFVGLLILVIAAWAPVGVAWSAPDPAQDLTATTALPESVIPLPIDSAPPVFHGTSHSLLFGRLKKEDETYYLVDWVPGNHVRHEIVSGSIRLEQLVGEQIALVADREFLPDGHQRYRAHHAVVVTQDLADQVWSGAGLIYLAPPGHLSLRLRGREVNLDAAPPVMGNGRTMVGLRAVAEGLGARVEWDGNTRSVTVTLADKEVLVQVGCNLVTVRQVGQLDRQVMVDVAPIIVNGHTMVPMRVLAEGLGLRISWSAQTQTVAVN